jgi:hypothetical protein
VPGLRRRSLLAAAWLVPRPGQLVHLEEMQRPEGGIVLAGADYAILDPSTINGAIEGGLTSAFAS